MDKIKKKNLSESYPMVGTEGGDYGWTSLTKDSIRDLDPLVQERMQEIAFYLYESNPIAHRIIEMTKDFVVGDGFTFKAENPKVQAVLDKHWNDYVNNWDLKQDQKAFELYLFGEQFYPVFINPYSGHVKLGYIDPEMVERVVKDKENPEIFKEVVLKTSRNGTQKKYKVINPNNQKGSKNYGLLEGEIFFFSINRVTSASRGRSILLSLCLHPDTLINTLEGDIPIKNLEGKKEVLVYSWNQESNELVIAKATNVRKTRENSELVKIHFTNGDSIITTPDHPILLINAKAYRQAKDFLPSDRVQALCRKVKDGYVWVQYKKSKWMLEHRFMMEKILGRKLSSDEIVHHKNGDTLDNRLSNLLLMTRGSHASHHIADVLLTPSIKAKQKKIISELMANNSYALGNEFILTEEQKEKVKAAKKQYYQNLDEKQRLDLKNRMRETSLSRFQTGKRINQYATFNHEIAYVEKLNYTSDVYDMTVERYGNFSANGILVHNCDWIDGYDQFLFSRLERAALLNNYIWDVLLEGADEETIRSFLSTQTMPKPGSIRAHNEKVKWNVVTPSFEASDASKEANLFKQQILGGAGFPNLWFGEGGETIRAGAAEMSLPTLKHLQNRQKYFKFIIRHILQFQIDQAIIAGKLGRDENTKFEVYSPPIMKKRELSLGVAVGRIADALKIATESAWVSKEEARLAFVSFMKEIVGADISGVQSEEDKE